MFDEKYYESMKKERESLDRIKELKKEQDAMPYESHNYYKGSPFYFDVEKLRAQREWDLFVERNERELRKLYSNGIVPIDIDKSNIQENYTLPLAEYERLKKIEEKYNAIKNSEEPADKYKYNLMKLDNGLWINGTRVNHLIDCKIDSSVDDPTEVTLKFVAKVDGLDNIDIGRYSFNDKE